MVEDSHGRRYEGRRFWGDPYVDLIDVPPILQILEELLGLSRWGHCREEVPRELRHRIRGGHDNIHFQSPWDGASRWRGPLAMKGGLHGGPTAHHITCVYELKSVGPGDGGFGCLPGAPKAPQAPPRSRLCPP